MTDEAQAGRTGRRAIQVASRSGELTALRGTVMGALWPPLPPALEDMTDADWARVEHELASARPHERGLQWLRDLLEKARRELGEEAATAAGGEG
jgi:hypothetical protein